MGPLVAGKLRGSSADRHEPEVQALLNELWSAFGTVAGYKGCRDLLRVPTRQAVFTRVVCAVADKP